MAPAPMRENAAVNTAGVELALSIAVACPKGVQRATMGPLDFIVVPTGLPRAYALSRALVVWILNALQAKLASERLSAPVGEVPPPAKCHAGGMEQFVLLVLLVHHVATVIPFGLTNLRKHVAKCHAGELTHVAWKERPAIAAAMVLVGYGSGWAITATKDKSDLGWPDKSGHAKSFCCRLGKSEVWADVRTW